MKLYNLDEKAADEMMAEIQDEQAIRVQVMQETMAASGEIPPNEASPDAKENKGEEVIQ